MATWLVDVSTKKQTRVELPRWAHPFALTPDGKAFVAALYGRGAAQCLRHQLLLVAGRQTAGVHLETGPARGAAGGEHQQLVIADADGKNPRTVLSGKAERATSITIGTMDWR